MQRYPKPKLQTGQEVSIANFGDVFQANAHPTDHTVLWGELFYEKERAFLRDHVTSGWVNFSIRDSFQIHYRIAWHPTSLDQLQKTGRTEAPVVCCLHAYSGRATSSWAWIKLARPLYQQGLTVIFLDMPGFGRSALNGKVSAAPSLWAEHDWNIVYQVMMSLGVYSRVNFVAYRESCGTVLRLVKKVPQSVAEANLLLDPVYKLESIFEEEVPIGGGHNWREAVLTKQQDELDRAFGKKGIGAWILAPEDGGPEGDEARRSFADLVHRRKVTESRAMVLSMYNRNHCCPAQAGMKAEECVLIVCRLLLRLLARYISRKLYYAPESLDLYEGSAAGSDAGSVQSCKMASIQEDEVLGKEEEAVSLPVLPERSEAGPRLSTRSNSTPVLPSLSRPASGLGAESVAAPQRSVTLNLPPVEPGRSASHEKGAEDETRTKSKASKVSRSTTKTSKETASQSVASAPVRRFSMLVSSNTAMELMGSVNPEDTRSRLLKGTNGIKRRLSMVVLPTSKGMREEDLL